MRGSNLLNATLTFNVGSVFVFLLTLSSASVLLLLLYLACRQQLMTNSFRCSKQRFFGLLGDSSSVPLKRMLNMGFSPGVGLLQSLMGYCHLYGQDGIFCIFAFFMPCVVCTKAETIESLIGGSKMLNKNWSYKFLRPWLGTGLLTSHSSKWKPRRKMLTPCFHWDILRDFMPVFNEKATILVRLMKEETEKEFTDIVLPLTLCSLDIICETAFGVSINAQENRESQYAKSIHIVTTLVYERFFDCKYWPEWYWLMKPGRQFMKHLKIVKSFSISVIQEKKKKILSGELDMSSRKRKALMDLLLEHHIQNKTLSEEDVLEEVETFATAGHDTTAMSMTWSLYLIGLHQDVQDKIHEELDRIFGEDLERQVTTDDIRDMLYFDCVLKEAQRIFTTVPLITREADCDTVVCGKTIPKGTTCMAVFHMLHRDESVFPDPEKFDPDRFSPENSANRHPFAYLPFSAGTRNCIGQTFAVMEEKVILATFLRHYSIRSLDPRDKIQLIPSIVIRPSGPIRIQIRPRTKW